MKKFTIFFFSVTIGFLLLGACQHELTYPESSGNPGTPTGGTTPPTSQPINTCNPDTVYFVNEILPMIVSNCATSGCHDAITKKEGIVLDTYSNITKNVKAGNGAGSKLYSILFATGEKKMPPPPRTDLTADQKAKIKKWIDQGAKNNSCSTGCDSTVFTFSKVVQPLIQNQCQGCHNPNSLGGGVDLSNYTVIANSAKSGKLYGSILHASGYSAMPKNGNKLSDCQIKQVKKWIDAKEPNN